jgi:hypothetical protein
MWGRASVGTGQCGDGRLRPSGGPVRTGPPGFEVDLDLAEVQGPKSKVRSPTPATLSTEYRVLSTANWPSRARPLHHRALCIPPPISVKRSRQDGGPTAICRRTLVRFCRKLATTAKCTSRKGTLIRKCSDCVIPNMLSKLVCWWLGTRRFRLV